MVKSDVRAMVKYTESDIHRNLDFSTPLSHQHKVRLILFVMELKRISCRNRRPALFSTGARQYWSCPSSYLL